MANLGEDTASREEARKGTAKVNPPTVKSMLVWSGLTVTSPGTIATSSKP